MDDNTERTTSNGAEANTAKLNIKTTANETTTVIQPDKGHYGDKSKIVAG